MIYIAILIVVFALSGFLLIYSVIRQSKMQPLPENCTDSDIQMMAMQGNKMQAIKWYKDLHNCSLKEAKEAVEKMMN